MKLPFSFFRAEVSLRPARVDDAPAIAGLHARAFAHPWPVLTIESMLAERGVLAHAAVCRGVVVGFVMARMAADEAEILSVSVADSRRGQGIGARLVRVHCEALILQRIRTVFLEVESENQSALRLYRRLGFSDIGCRPGYYRQADGTRRDALMMRLDLSGITPSGPLLDV